MTLSRLLVYQFIAKLLVMKNTEEKSTYHHGDLRETLLLVATEMLQESGIKEVSLRKLASRVGVSRTAPYHHFKDKNALLCGIAEKGFEQLHQINKYGSKLEEISVKERFYRFIHDYIQFANNNPELYELMFGRTIWKDKSSTLELRDSAYPCFQFQVDMTQEWQKQGLFNVDDNALRVSQVLWGTVHGIAKLFIDGIYTDNSKIDDICDYAVRLFLSNSTR
ncbi:MAG: AcrR family transcriptional regulator [Colwellia sp.]|jgi:AcrR family transcriptional regulator